MRSIAARPRAGRRSGNLTVDRLDIAEGYFAHWQAQYPGLDRRGGAAFLIGGVAYVLAATMAALHFTEGVIPEVSRLAVQLVDGELRCRLADGVPLEASDTATIAQRLEAVLAPLVARLKMETGLAPAAQWRCVADSFAAAFMSTGRALGCEAEARQEALAILAGDHAFSNRQTGYREISIACADGTGVSRFFLKRGGCCRYYTADNAGYCTTCILRPEAEQVARLTAYLSEGRGLAQAAE